MNKERERKNGGKSCKIEKTEIVFDDSLSLFLSHSHTLRNGFEHAIGFSVKSLSPSFSSELKE